MNALMSLPQDLWLHSLLPFFSNRTLYALAGVSSELNSFIWKMLADLTFYRSLSSCTCEEYLTRCPSLTSLGFFGTGLKPEYLENIHRFTTLTKLNLKNCRLYDGSGPLVNQLTSLTSLVFSTAKTQEEFETLTDLSNLSQLTMEWTTVTDDGFQAIQHFTKLESLSLYFAHITSLEPLMALTNLCNLSIEWCENVTGLGQELPLTRLESLNLAGSSIQDSGLSALGTLKNLTALDLTDCPISNIALQHLQPCHSLQRLTLQGLTKINDMGMKSIKHLTRLQELDLSGTHVFDKGLQRLSKLLRLQRLYLFNTKISLQSLSSLEPMLELAWLDLRSCFLTEQTVSLLVELKQLRNLERLLKSGSIQF